MYILIFLILFPLAAAAALFFVSDKRAGTAVSATAAAVEAIGAAALYAFFSDGGLTFQFSNGAYLPVFVLSIAGAIAAAALGVLRRRFAIPLLAVAQVVLLAVFRREIEAAFSVADSVCVDKLSLLLILLIAVVGSLMIFTAYRKGGGRLAAGMLILQGCCVGAAASNNLLLLLCFWNLASLPAFLLLDGRKLGRKIEKNPDPSAFYFLAGSLFGGCCLILAMPVLWNYYQAFTITRLAALGNGGVSVVAPAALAALAGLSAAAQLPFSFWLSGKSSGPAPAAAQLQGAGFAAVGAALLLRLSPALGWNLTGMAVAAVGAATFLSAVLSWCAESEEEKALGWSAAAMLSLITLCAAAGSYAACGAGMLLLFYHGVCRAALQCAGPGSPLRAAAAAAMTLTAAGLIFAKEAVVQAFWNYGSLLPLLALSGGMILFLAGGFRQLRACAESGQKICVPPPVWRQRLGTALLAASFLALPLLSRYAASPFVEKIYENRQLGTDGLLTGDLTIAAVVIVSCLLIDKMYRLGAAERLQLDDREMDVPSFEQSECGMDEQTGRSHSTGYPPSRGAELSRRLGAAFAAAVIVYAASVLIGGVL